MAGTLTVTSRVNIGLGIQRIDAAWTSDASGDVSGHAFEVPTGMLLQVKTVPDGVAAPSDNYDLTVVDADGADLLGGAGTDRDTSAAEVIAPLLGDATTKNQRPLVDGTGTLDVVIANAGNAKKGTVSLWIGR
jgi:hypothetical protein